MATVAARPRGAFTAELAGRAGPSEEQRQRQAAWQAELRAQAEDQKRAREAEKQREKERDRLDEERYMRDIAAARNEAGDHATANKPRGRRSDPNAQSVLPGVPGGASADSTETTYGFGVTAADGAVKPSSDGRQAGTWDSGVATNAARHPPLTQLDASAPAAGGSISSLLSSMRLGGGGDAVHSAPGGLGLEHTWGRAAAIDVGNLLGSSSGTSELDSMFDSLMAEQRQLKTERRRSNGVASAPSSFARGLGSASINERWGSTQGLSSTQTRRRWGAVPLGTTSNFGPRATRGVANFRSVTGGSRGSSSQASGGSGRYGGYSLYGSTVRNSPRRRRTFETIDTPQSPGFGPRVPYNQDGFSPMASVRSNLGGDGGLPPPVHVSQEAARAHRRLPYQQQDRHWTKGQHEGHNYSGPGRGIHHRQYESEQLQHDTQGQVESTAEPNYNYHEPQTQQQMQQRWPQEDTRHGDELGQTTSSRFLDREESDRYLDDV